MADVYVLGAGAVGLSFAHHLSSKHNVTILSRNRKKTDFYYQEQTTKKPIKASIVNVTELPSSSKKPIKNCFICVKSYQLDDAFKAVQPSLHNEANYFLSHNGIIELPDILCKLTSKQRLFFISTSRGAFKPGLDLVVQTGFGDTYLGACNDEASVHINCVFESLLANTIKPSSIHNNMTLLRWQKLMVNIAINPLTAINQITNGELLKPKYAFEVMNLLNEACRVASEFGIEISLKDALDNAYTVMRQTYKNHSSMAQDVKQQRKTEIEAICGYIVNEANKLNINVPFNKALLEKINQL